MENLEYLIGGEFTLFELSEEVAEQGYCNFFNSMLLDCTVEDGFVIINNEHDESYCINLKTLQEDIDLKNYYVKILDIEEV